MLRVENLTVEIRGATILDNVSVEVADGQVLSVLGPSGSGKTTLLRTIAGLQRATRGKLNWDDTDLVPVPVENRGFGLMFQDYALFPHQSIGSNVAFGLRMQHRDAGEIQTRVAEVLDWVGMAGYQDRKITNLSGGEQQRVALARALAPSPRLLMLDEPLGSLDRTLRERLIVELRELLVDHSITAVYVTHDQEEAFTIGDRLLVLRDGSVAQIGTPESVYRKPADEWTARFLGFQNIIPAEVADGVASTPWISFDAGAVANGPATFVVPPDGFRVGGSGAPAKVVGRSFRGGHYLLQVEVIDGPLLDVEVAGTAPQVGDTITVQIQNATPLPVLASTRTA